MNKKEITIPRGIKYLSKWENFRFSNFPSKCIIDKVVPGCGFTEYCLTGPENVILCSPRKMLLENKKEAHGDSVYLVRNELEVTLNYDKNLERPDKSATTMVVRNPTKDETEKVYRRIYDELELYGSARFNQGNLPCKILVTYDSFHIVKEILEHREIFKDFYVVIDEFQTILHDGKFKSDTELRFLEYLDQSHSSLFVSATPMMEEYLDMLDEFKDLPYYVLDWITEDNTRIIQPDIKPLTMMSVGTKCSEIIQRYKSGNFEKVNIVDKNGQIKEIVSTEAVFYVNSVNHIINIINKCDLQPEEVNILCSDTDYNRRRLRLRLNKHSIGKVPLKTEPNKMFTFCTRTVYLGADFYSKCARSFVFSDANINTLVVDISEDLAQILGRQRDEENPWARSAVFYYTTTSESQEKLKLNLDKKLAATNNLLQAYNEASTEDIRESLADNYEYVAKAANYRDNYVAVNSGKRPVLNKLAMIAEKRAYEIQKYDYADRVSIFSHLEKQFGGESIQNFSELGELKEQYDSLTKNEQRLRLLCSVDAEMMYKFINLYLGNSDIIKSSLLTLGQKKITALGYNTTRITKEINNQKMLQSVVPTILNVFLVGGHYSNTYIISKLQEIYDKNGLGIKAKATDIGKWFEVKSLKLVDNNAQDKKRVHGLKLIGIKGTQNP